MTTELTLLAWSALLCMLLPYPAVGALLQIRGGFAWGLGNRDQSVTGLPPWAERARRAHTNLVENLAPFAAVVLIAHVAGRNNGLTVLGAELFFWGRIAHAATYIAGLTPWRTLAFAVSSTGTLLIFLQLL
jgi:uncharacterized MAPEG superfamily protein